MKELNSNISQEIDYIHTNQTVWNHINSGSSAAASLPIPVKMKHFHKSKMSNTGNLISAFNINYIVIMLLT